MAGLRVSRHHCRKLVGLVVRAVRGTMWSMPSFFAINMFTMAWAMPSDAPRPIIMDFISLIAISWKRTGLPSTSDMMEAISLQERSSGPRIGTLATPLQDGSESSRAATAATSRLAQAGALNAGGLGQKNTPRLLI